MSSAPCLNEPATIPSVASHRREPAALEAAPMRAKRPQAHAELDHHSSTGVRHFRVRRSSALPPPDARAAAAPTQRCAPRLPPPAPTVAPLRALRHPPAQPQQPPLKSSVLCTRDGEAPASRPSARPRRLCLFEKRRRIRRASRRAAKPPPSPTALVHRARVLGATVAAFGRRHREPLG